MLFRFSTIAAAAFAFFLLYRRRNTSSRSLRGQVVVVTGASSGIGKEIAFLAAAQGAVVVVAARRLSVLEQVAAECLKRGAKAARAVECDITNPDACVRLSKIVEELQFPLGLLVLNAGRGGIASFDQSPASMKVALELMEVNYFANVRLTQCFLHLLTQHKAQLLVVSSLSGVLATPQRAQYCASKFAVQGFFTSLRSELANEGVHVTIANPGWVKTEFHEKVRTSDGSQVHRKQKTMMSAEECARQCLKAAQNRQNELMMTWLGWLAVRARPFVSPVVDQIAVRQSKANIHKL